MNTQKIPSAWLTSKLTWSVAALLIAAGIFIWLPHRTQVIETHATLQTGKKLDVQFTLESPWGWCSPDRLTEMHVSLDGKNLSMPKEVYEGLGPIDPTHKPAIGERLGFPEITVYGKSGSLFNQVKWMFLNNSYSERHLMRNHNTEISYHAEPPPAPATFTGKPGIPDKNGIVAINLDGGTIRPLPIKKVSK